MKKLITEKLTEEQIDFLKNLKESLLEIDSSTNACWGTSDPYWTIASNKRIYHTDDNSDGYEIYDGLEVSFEDIEEFKEYIIDNEELTDEEKMEIRSCTDFFDFINTEVAEEKLSKWQLIGYKVEEIYHEYFLTPEAAQNYLKINGHNLEGYDHHPYAKSNFRNYQMLELKEIIKNLEFEEERKD